MPSGGVVLSLTSDVTGLANRYLWLKATFHVAITSVVDMLAGGQMWNYVFPAIKNGDL